MDLLRGLNETGGSVLEGFSSLESISRPGVDERRNNFQGRPSVILTNAGVGEVVPSPLTPALVVSASILEGCLFSSRLSKS